MKEKIEIQETKTVWLTMVNTDRTEGKGTYYPMAVSEHRSTAKRLGIQKDVQGSDASVASALAVKINGQWLAPCYINKPSNDDLLEEETQRRLDSVVDKLKKSGMMPAEIDELFDIITQHVKQYK